MASAAPVKEKIQVEPNCTILGYPSYHAFKFEFKDDTEEAVANRGNVNHNKDLPAFAKSNNPSCQELVKWCADHGGMSTEDVDRFIMQVAKRKNSVQKITVMQASVVYNV